ncbi:Spermidine N(1)-acetyltransferase [Jeotgalibaca dankookensis]|uniref:Spermidine N(1)-acetyltransferase n=1 Tax=Jeotgalibaca dankookensis TaxID=708126 RepID=A0A1S6IM46_9LACT|nr:GNAT family protein [Jeotgalibaca dankookensis]AQS52638.1 Spermidine N(1)-acetyltransferase [Jeotgalibaca dankookensis]
MVRIRRFRKEDIPYKVKWVNDSENNKYLHYHLPLEEDKTLLWFNSTKNQSNRRDYTITYSEVPIGLIGLLNIDYQNKKAEYYIMIGNTKHKGKGIAKKASELLIEIGYREIKLNKIYLYTEVENNLAQKLFESIGFSKEGVLKEDLIVEGVKIDRFIYGLLMEEHFKQENNND